MKPLDSNEIMQIGIVVRDIEKAAKEYSELFGVEMPNIRNAFPTITYRGQKITTHSRLCAIPMGHVMLELVQPDEGPSSWREFLDTHGEGVHHIGFVVKDLDGAFKTLEEHGIAKRQYGGAQWGSYCFMDSEKLGVLFNVKCDKPYEEK